MAFITIHKANFFHNLSQLAIKAGSKERLAVVLKDNAYGHGLEIMAQLAQEFGITQAVVISAAEARTIGSYFRNILILNDVPFYDERFSFALTDVRQLETVDPAARIELKVDTGMHRNGIAIEELDGALEQIRARGLNLIGVMTHYRSADVLSSELMWQKKRFEAVKQRVKKAGFASVRFHSHNSAALLRANTFDEAIARVGIAIYGYNTLPKPYDQIKLQPVLALHAQRVSTRRLNAGERIGYGGDFTASAAMTVSTYDIGYGDGWPRADTHDPYVTAEGLPILGRVSMDFVTLEGDRPRVCIMDDARRAAEHFGTICYEMTTRLMPTIERRIV
jgi:alanine racemase